MKTNQNNAGLRSMPGDAAAAAKRTDPRLTMARLPTILQPALTAITGKALPSEEPLIEWTGTGRFWQVQAGMFTGIAASAWLWATGGWALGLLPASWLLTVWGMRSNQITVIHHGAHDTLFANKSLNAPVGELLSAMLWILPFAEYKKGHLPHHAATATDRDVDLQFLKFLGFRPGLSVAEYWRQLWRMLFSPRFHATYLKARLKANFVSAAPARRALAYVWTALAAAIFALAPGAMTVAFLIPAILLFQASGLLQLLTEHSWVRIGERVNSVKHILSRVTTGRFMGCALPEVVMRGGSRLRMTLAMAGWIFRMLALHLPARLFVVQGDLPNHDYHHRKPGSPAWANASIARRDDAQADPNGWLPYDEVWGLKQALELTFTRLSQLPPDAVLGEPLTYGEVSDAKLTM